MSVLLDCYYKYWGDFGMVFKMNRSYIDVSQTSPQEPRDRPCFLVAGRTNLRNTELQILLEIYDSRA